MFRMLKATGQSNEMKNDIEDRDLESQLTTSVLKLEEIDRNLYRGTHLWQPVGGRSVFGGQVAGQALVAAGKTKVPGSHVHSLHCYFIRPGNPDIPIIYHVERTRDGESFSSRQVNAVQNGDVILTMIASYQMVEPAPFEYQYLMPSVTPPEELISSDDILRKMAESGKISEKRKAMINKILAQEVPMDIRPVDPMAYMKLGQGQEPKLMVWMKAKGHIGTDNNINRCVAAYMSDYTLLRTATVPYPTFQPQMMASLDHCMWFHSPFRTDEWMLYECESPRAVGARALSFGRLWRKDGVLAVSVAQEGVIRGKPVETTSKL